MSEGSVLTPRDERAVSPKREWPPLDEKGRIPKAILEREWLSLAHRVIANLHAAKAQSGLSWEEIAARIGWKPSRVKRAFWDPQMYRGMKELSDLSVALGAVVRIDLQPVVFRDVFAEDARASTPVGEATTTQQGGDQT